MYPGNCLVQNLYGIHIDSPVTGSSYIKGMGRVSERLNSVQARTCSLGHHPMGGLSFHRYTRGVASNTTVKAY